MTSNKRILIVDDNHQIHDVLNKILNPLREDINETVIELETFLFEEEAAYETPRRNYQIDSAFQGQEGIDKVVQALAENSPYALAFIDMRMPPGIDGLETIKRIWSLDPQIEIVICSAYSDYSWDEILKELGETEQLLFLSKPFTTVAAQQLALSQVRKWELKRSLYEHVESLESTLYEQVGYGTLLKHIAITSNQSTSVEEASVQILKHICQYTSWPIGNCYLLDSDSLFSTLVSYNNSADEQSQSIPNLSKLTIDIATLLSNENYKHGSFCQSLELPESHPLYSYARELSLNSLMTIPVYLNEEIVAILEFYSHTEGDVDKQWLENFDVIASQLSQVIKRIWECKEYQSQIECLKQQLQEYTTI